MGAALASMMAYGTVGAVLLFEVRSLTGCTAGDLLIPASGEVRAEWSRLFVAVPHRADQRAEVLAYELE